MTTYLKTLVNKINEVELEAVPGSSTESTLTFKKTRDLGVWSDDVAPGTSGLKNPKNKIFPTSDRPKDNKKLENNNCIVITGPTPILTTFYNLVNLKLEVKGTGKGDIQLAVNKNLNSQSDHWDIKKEGNKTTIYLTPADFSGGGLSIDHIIIDDITYRKKPTIDIDVDRSDQKKELLNLEDFLTNHLPARYGVNYPELNFTKGPDVDLIDPGNDLGDPPSLTDPIPKNGLWSYATGTNIVNSKFDVTKDPTNIKHILFDLIGYKDKVKNWLRYLFNSKEYLSIGLTKKSQVAIMLENEMNGGGGYTNADIPEIKKEPGFYKSFPILDPNLEALPDSADGNKFKISKVDSNKPVRYTKTKIDNFRAFATGYTGLNSDIFTKEKTIKDKDGKDVQVFANRLPEECFGFQPGDIIQKGGDYVYINGKQKFAGKTKIYCDILSAQNAEEAMDLAFFGKDYEEPQSDNAARKGNQNPNFEEKHPNVNLQFNEVKGWTRLEHLDHYHEALKDSTNCKWRTPDNGAGTMAKDAPNYDDPNIKQTIDKNYDLTKEFIADYEQLKSVTNISSLNKTQLEEAKTKLEKWKTTRFYTSNGVWKPIIDNFLDEVNGALSLLNDDPDDDVPAWKTELAGLKNRGSELAKKIYQNCQPEQDGFTEQVFEELKKLVKLLEEAHGTNTTNTKSQLEQFISDSENDTNKKKALEIAKKVKNQDSDNKNCVDSALEKLKTPQDNKLERARQELKGLLAGLKIDGKDAYEKIISDIKDSEETINKFITIWKKCQEVDIATNDDNGELLDALNNLKNDTSNEKAWELVNKYKKDGQGQGYANDMLKKLNDWAEQRKKDYQDVKNAKSKAEFEVYKTEFMKKHEYKNNQKDYDEIYFPLAEKAAEIREKGSNAQPDEKKLIELITLVVSDYNDWKTQLKDLEDKLKEIKTYVQGEKNKVIANFSTTQKEALNKLINKMETKVKEWKQEKSKFEKNNPSQENPPWYKTPLGIIGILAVVALVIGLAAYFVKQNINEED